MPLRDLVLYLGNRRATGALTIFRAQTKKEAILHGGQIVTTSSNEPGEYLGNFLIAMGHLTQEQFDKAYRTQKETQVSLGKILVMIGIVQEATVINALSLKFRETLLSAYTWTDGRFEFTPSAPPPAIDALEAKVDLLDLNREAEFRETAWLAIRAVFRHGDLRLTVNEENFPERPPKPSSLDAKVIEFAKAGDTISQMAKKLNITEFFFYQRLYALHRLEALHPVLPGDLDEEEVVGVEVIGDEPAEDELIARTFAFIREKNFRDAEALARRAFELRPTAQVAELLHQAEAGLIQRLREELITAETVPHIRLAPTKLKVMRLTSAQRYLLSRIDGKRDVPSILHLSPLQEVEALRLMQGFVESGLLEFAPPRP